MGYKRIIRKIAKFILASQPKLFVQVNVGQIQSGNILQGKKIVITGGGSGLGFAMAKKFADEGAEVLISGRNEEKLKTAVKQLKSQCKYAVADVCDVEHSMNFLENAKNQLGGRIDCLVSNAGVSLHETIYKNVTIKGFDKQFNTKFRAGYFLGKAFLEMKTKEKTDELLNAQLLYITSETGDQVYDIPYGMTNAALNSLVGAFSRRVYKQGIRVNAVAPGVTLTEMTRNYAEASDGNLYRDCASDRTFVPEEVAEVACFLLSDASRCISGEIIHCNAGNHLKAFWDESK
ncbi:MAG: SDR family oxidoreductase [Lachnospiraceae bacterium]|nr:SDR family oxidoreductase [Lachnospiraceae bacterium]